ncbi:MAG: amino acid adenylation domain-containing protein [Phycisphaerales bacterium]
MGEGRTILDAIDGAFAAHGDRVAIEEWPSGRRLSYAQLDVASATLAAALAEHGVGPGSFVPIVMPRSAEFLVAIVATLRTGAAYAPIDPADPRREALLKPLDAPIVVGTESGMLDPSHAGAAAPLPEVDIDPEAPAYVMYTSGTTGEPKGVVVPHRAVIRLVEGADFASFGPDHRWAVMSAVAFDASTLEVWGALLHGGCAVVQYEPVPSLDQLDDYFKQGRVGHAWLTAALFNTIFDERPDALAGVEQILTGGERESVTHIRRCLKRHPNLALIHGYGPTENTTFSLCHRITKDDARQDRIPIGFPIAGSTARIVSPDAGPDEPAVSIDRGELLVGGEGLALGYLNDPAKTAEKFVNDRDNLRWYRTGDLVQRREDGAIVFLGRVDRQVKIRGHRIEPDGVERELISCAGVEQAAVAVAGDAAETRQLVAFIVLEPPASIDAVRSELSDRLPPSMLPTRLIAVDRMPIGGTGKIDRSALLASIETHDRPITQASSETEARLIELFSARLGHAITATERFQDAGGHSLMAMRLSADMRRELGVTLPAVEILRRQTIDNLAILVDSLPQSVAPQHNEALSEAVGDIRRRASLEHERDPTGRAMLVHHAWHVSPAIPIERLRAAWTGVLERDDGLRTSVMFGGAGPELRRHDPHSAPVFHAEQDRLDAPNPRHPLVERAAQRTIGRGDPPARLHAWDVEDGSQLVLMVFHHAAIDEWSLDLVTQELSSALRGIQSGPCVPYAAFVRAEHAMSSTSLAHDIGERIASGGPSTNEAPKAGPQPGRFHTINRSDLTEAVFDERARDLGVSPAALAMAAFGQVLRQRYGPPGRWVLTPFAKRPTEELQRVVGCCLDMRPIEVSGESVSESARVVHTLMLDAHGDTTLPLETLIDRVREIDPTRAEDATRFGFTYRLIDDAPTTLGQSTATPIDIEPAAARFGLCLHVERRRSGLRLWLESARSHYSQSQLEAIGNQIASAILGVDTVAPSSTRTASDASRDNSTSKVSTAERAELAQVWTELLGNTPDDSVNFFSQGGTSLTAMRLAALVHRRTGRKLMLNQFLRTPTFENLAASVRDDTEQPFAEYSHGTENTGDSPWCVAIPGSAGRAIDVHRLWMLAEAPGRIAKDMLAFDLATIATTEESSFDPRRFFGRFTALTHAHATAVDRRGPITLLGYSLGGLVAMDMARKLADLGHTIDRVVLLDAYAPAYLSRTRMWYLAKINAKLRRIGARGTPPRIEETVPDSGDAHAAEASRAEWKHIHETLSSWSPPRLDVPVTLVRSASAWDHVRPIHHAQSNGLGPWLGTNLDVRVLDVEHLSMLTSKANTVAEAIIDGLTLPLRPSTPTSRAARRSPSDRHPARP